MPLNTPVKNRSILPDALAFPETSALRAGAGVYQNTVNNVVNNNIFIEQTTVQGASEYQAANTAQHYGLAAETQAAEWHVAFDGNGSGSLYIAHNTWVPLAFLGESVVNTPGAYSVSGGARFRVPHSAAGVWWFYGFCAVVLHSAIAATRVRLAIFRNNAIYSIVDDMPLDFINNTAITKGLVKGGRHVVCNGGDLIEFMIFVNANPGGSTLTHDGDIWSYAGGHRVSCDTGAKGGLSGQNLNF